MPPKRRGGKSGVSHQEPANLKKLRKTMAEIEKSICRGKLDALDQEESLIKDNRFTFEERRLLLDAFSEKGFPVFQDTKLLHQYLPNRREADLKGLVERLKSSLLIQLASTQGEEQAGDLLEQSKLDNLNHWQGLCRRVLGNFAKDRRVNFDDVFSDALNADAEDLERGGQSTSSTSEPNYPRILRSFAQLLSGKFPEPPNPVDAIVSMRLYYDLESVADSIDLSGLSSITSGSWLENSIKTARKRQELAVEGLSRIDGKIKKLPSSKDIDDDRSLEALCLELPKIRRITDVLNPLHIDRPVNEALILRINDTST